MSGPSKDMRAREILIVRRRLGSGDDLRHSGVWKIAYADFMTALMTFFLVMWLVNTADDETRNQVASYFNPLTLTDNITATKGVRDLEHMPESGLKAKNKPTPHASGELGGDPASKLEIDAEALFRDPFGMLSQIASSAPKMMDAVNAAPGGPQAEASKLPAEAASSVAEHSRGTHTPDILLDPFARPEAGRSPEKPAEAGEEREPAKAEMLRAQIENAFKLNAGVKPAVEVFGTSEGVLITLSDSTGFGMFGIGSAIPQPATVTYMEGLAGILESHPENLVVRGHTDGRQYRGKAGGNWRLSSDRAQVAYFMLLRGGVKEGRFARIEGHADRDLKRAGDPLAAENRRIEILLLQENK